jgi:para-aminobenzoate synthetase/4-amino-4-deoxychorismate lyase
VKDFALIETMRVSESGDVYLLERHLHRLSRSAQYFDFKCDDRDVRDRIREAIPPDGRPCCLRLTLFSDGALHLQPRPLPSHHAEQLKLATVQVKSDDVFLCHKTTNREIYDQARAECDDRTDVILVNERGEVTETTVTNIAVSRGDRWITPRISCGLLPGVMREELLARGEIVEGIVASEELREGEPIRCFNALRGVRDVPYYRSY